MLLKLALVGGVLGAILCGCGDDPATCPNDLPPTCVDAGIPSYQTDIVPLIMSRCYPCHGPGGVEQSTHDYTNYAGVYAHRREILDAVHACIMPPIDSPPPTPAERATLFHWLVCGAPNN